MENNVSAIWRGAHFHLRWVTFLITATLASVGLFCRPAYQISGTASACGERTIPNAGWAWDITNFRFS